MELQGQYQTALERLEIELAEMRVERDTELEQLLSESQRAILDQLRARSASTRAVEGAAPAPPAEDARQPARRAADDGPLAGSEFSAEGDVSAP